MSDAEKPQAEEAKPEEKKDPSLGDKAKKVIKDEAIRTATWEGRSFLYRLFGHRIGRVISQIFGK
jgi:hypothetical protein